MRPLFVLPLAFLISGLSFPLMLIERLRPNLDRIPEETIEAIDHPTSIASALHSLKDYTTEAVRGDAQWWSKCFCFVILVLLVIIAL